MEGGGWKMNDVGIEGGEIYRQSCFYLGGQNRQLRRYKLTCVACVTLNCGVRLQYASYGDRHCLSMMSFILRATQ